jgi:tRNA pseudouridine13 synthase
MLRGDYDEALSRMLGQPGPLDRGQVREARKLFERGDFLAAAEAWPYPFRSERRLCRALAKARGDGRRAFGAIDKTLRRFFRSAYQSYLFNQVVARRIDTLDRLQAGDLAWRHPQGAVFRVEDPALEQSRCAAFEISPTGPLFGYRMTMPTGEPGACEQELLAEANLTLGDWRDGPERKVKGGRRPLRFRPDDTTAEAGQDNTGAFIELAFRLESGCYATTLLREICKWPEHGGSSGGLETDS